MNKKIVVYKDGSWLAIEVAWEFEGDPDYLCTIDIQEAIDFKYQAFSSAELADFEKFQRDGE